MYNLKGDEDIIAFINPFDAVIMEQVLNNIRHSLIEHPRKVTLFYVKSAHHELFIQKGFVEKNRIYLKTDATCIYYTNY